jgi:hypothetical protein
MKVAVPCQCGILHWYDLPEGTVVSVIPEGIATSKAT